MKEIDCVLFLKRCMKRKKDYKDRIYEEDEKLQVLAENSMESLVLLLDDIKARKIIRSYIQAWEYVSFLYYKLRCIKWNRK